MMAKSLQSNKQNLSDLNLSAVALRGAVPRAFMSLFLTRASMIRSGMVAMWTSVTSTPRSVAQDGYQTHSQSSITLFVKLSRSRQYWQCKD